MMENNFKIPFYAKAALIFISVFTFVFIMYIGRDIIIPIVYATIFAILLNPFVNFLTRKKISKIVAISIAVSLTMFIVLVILYIIFSRISMFSESFPEFKLKLDQTSDQLVRWISHEFNYSQAKINRWITERQNETVSNFASGETLSYLSQITITLVLVPVYLFMILYH